MWRKETKENEGSLLDKAIKFTGDHKLYGSWMMKVINEWPIACEHNLTDVGLNRRAWIGQAAVCLGIGCPEYITRAAWWKLTKEQQDKANAEADKAIRQWEHNYLTNKSSVQLKMFDKYLVVSKQLNSFGAPSI